MTGAAGGQFSGGGPPPTSPQSFSPRLPKAVPLLGSWHIHHCHLKALGSQAAADRPAHLVFLSGSGVLRGASHPGKPCTRSIQERQDHQKQHLFQLHQCDGGRGDPRVVGKAFITPSQGRKSGLTDTHRWDDTTPSISFPEIVISQELPWRSSG